LVSAMFQSMGGDAMIGQSTINVKSGGIGRLSTTFAAIMFFLFILALSSVIELVPVSALTGILFMVVIYTFDWSCLPLMAGVDVDRFAKRQPTPEHATKTASIEGSSIESKSSEPGQSRWQDSVLILLVTVVTVLTNLAVAVITGVIVAALFFAWDAGAEITVTSTTDEVTKTYVVTGPLFFASDRAFKNSFASVSDDPPRVIVDMQNSSLRDLSSLAALAWLGQKYVDAGKKCAVRLSSPSDMKLLRRFGKRINNLDIIFSCDQDMVVMTDKNNSDGSPTITPIISAEDHPTSTMTDSASR